MSDIIAHTDISTRTSQSNVKANKLDVNDTQYHGTCKGSSSEDLQKDDESSSPHKVLAQELTLFYSSAKRLVV